MKTDSCARDRRALQQLVLNVHVKHSDQIRCEFNQNIQFTKKEKKKKVNKCVNYAVASADPSSTRWWSSTQYTLYTLALRLSLAIGPGIRTRHTE